MADKQASGQEKPPEISFFENSQYLLRLFKKTINDAVKIGYKGFLNASLINIAENNFKGYEPKFIIETFIHKSYAHWDEIQIENLEEKDANALKEIQDKQDIFICNNASVLFSGPIEKYIDINKVVKEIYEKKFNKNDTIITPSCRTSVMRTLRSFVKFSIEYLDKNPVAMEKVLDELKTPEEVQILKTKFAKYRNILFPTQE